MAHAVQRLLLLLALCAVHRGTASAPAAASGGGDARKLLWLSPPPPPPVPLGTYWQNSATCTLSGIAASSMTSTSTAYSNLRLAMVVYFDVSQAWEVQLTGVTAAGSGSAVAFTIRSGGSTTGKRILGNLTALVASPGPFLAAVKTYEGLTGVTGVAFTTPTLQALVPSPDSAAVPPYSPPSPLPPPPPNPGAPPGFTYVLPTFTNSSQQAAHVTDVAAMLTSSNLSTSGAALLARTVASSLNSPSSLLSSNATAAAAVRETLLTALVNSSAVNASSSDELDQVSNAVVSLVANASQISAGGAVAALSLLSNIASAGTAVSNQAGQAVANSLSSLVSASRTPNSTLPATSTFGAVLGVVNSLSGSLLVGIQPGAPPQSVSSDHVKLTIQVDAPGDDRLYTASFTAPGSVSTFQPLPSSLLSNAADDLSAGVATTFTALSFDPYAAADDPDTTGVTSLVLSSQASGNPVNISGLSDPIFFALPAPKLGDVGTTSVQCQFWDTAALQYSTIGCVAQPDPQPPSPDHDIQWADGFSASSDADMLNAWSGTGPLYTGCTTQVLDCTQASPGVVYPNPAAPFEVPAVSCADNTTTPMLVFIGSTCQLINTSNSYNCTWDNYQQAFVGGGCEITGDSVQCACRHLTTFSGASRYNIPVATPSEMASLDPGELVTRLRLLFIVVCSLFGFMNVGAFYGWVIDRAQMRKFMSKLCTPKSGYRVVKATGSKIDAHGTNDVWLWRFHMEPLRGKIDAPAGPAVHLSDLLGLPAARIRAAIADDLLSWSMATAVGRQAAFSADGFTAGLNVQQAQARSRFSLSLPKPLRDLLERRRIRKRSKMDTTVDAGDLWEDEQQPAEEEEVELDYDPEHMRLEEEFVGTGLVLAFIQVAQLMPVVEHAKRKSAAKHYFGEFRSSAGWDFDKVCTDFVTLLSPGMLNCNKWLIRARMWRLIMCQEPSGAWKPDSSTAFALEARSLHEVQNLSHSLWAKLTAILGLILSLLTGGGGGGGLAGGGLDADDVGDALDEKPETADELEKERKRAEEEAAKPSKPPNALMRRWQEHKAKKEAARRAKAQLASDMAPVGPSKSKGRSLSRMASIIAATKFGPQDCPLTNYDTSIIDIMPHRLAHLEALGVDAKRVWTTLCCISLLEDLPFSFIWGDGDTYPEEERTIVDAGREWIERHAVDHPALAEALADGLLEKRAKAIIGAWHATQERRVEELRRSDGITQQMAASQTHRTITGIVRAFCTQNDTFSVFLSEPLDGLQRWQMFMIIVTLVCSHLLVNIWMFYAKSVNCCADIRGVLDGGLDGGNCPASDFNAPCRGFTGECGALEDQFANVAVLPDYPNGMVDYDCTAFPNDNNPLDSFIVGLISIAIALPVGLFLESCFEIANDSEQPESILIWTGLRKLVFGPNAHRKWHYTRGKQPSRYVRWWLRSQDAPKPETILNLIESARAYFTGTLPWWTIEAREAEEEAMAEQVDEVLDETLDEALEAPSGSQHTRSDCGSEHELNHDGSERANSERGSGHARSESGASTSESIEEARALRLYKRLVMSAGLIGVYICWAVFAWFIFTYGSLIYVLLGQKSEGAFARSWGISYGLNLATEWRGIVIQAAKGAFVLAVLERLCLTRPQPWLEDAIDYYSLQALLFKSTDVGFFAKIRTMYRHTKRISE